MFSNSSLHSMTDPMCFVQMIHNYMEHLERTKHQHAAAAAEPADTGANTSVRIRWVCIPHLQFLIFHSYYPSAAQKLPSRLFGGYVQVILQPWVEAIQCSVSSSPTHISFCLARGRNGSTSARSEYWRTLSTLHKSEMKTQRFACKYFRSVTIFWQFLRFKTTDGLLLPIEPRL